MEKIERYRSTDLPDLLDKISRNSIGLDNYFDQFFKIPSSNYPPYNLINLNNHESRLEIALAGFKKEEVKVYTEYGKLVVEGTKPEEKQTTEYFHRGLARRNFNKSWTLSEDCVVDDVTFENGLLTIELKKIVPEKHARKDYI